MGLSHNITVGQFGRSPERFERLALPFNKLVVLTVQDLSENEVCCVNNGEVFVRNVA